MGRTVHFAGTAMVSLILTLFVLGGVSGQSQADRDAVNQLLDRYAELEEAMDMTAQAGLISENRVWIAQAHGPPDRSGREHAHPTSPDERCSKRRCPAFGGSWRTETASYASMQTGTWRLRASSGIRRT